MKSDCKSFEVFEFNKEDEFAEVASAKLLSKFKNPSAVDKYHFLENVARGTNFESKEMNNLPCVDVDAIDNDQNCDNAISCIALGLEGEDPAIKQMCGLDEAFVVNSVSHEQQSQFIPDKLKAGSFATQLESRASSPGAASPGSSQFNSALQESPSSDESDDVIPDADVIPDVDESMSASSPSTSSDIQGDDVTLDGHGLLPGYCFGSWEMGNRNEAVVCPDYVVYRGRYCTESMLIFSSSCIELKLDSTAHGDQETLNFKWGIDDIVDIRSQWSERLRVAMVKLRIISKDEMQAEGGQGTSGIEELQFAAVELNWYKKQEEIMSLDVRYKALWNAVYDSDIGGDVEDLPGQNGVCISKTKYLPNFDEPFEEVVYPKGDSDAVTISKQDVDLLQPDTFVNDTIIDFYIKFLKNELRPEKRHRFHFFNSFFFRKLIDLDKDPSSAFEGRAAFQRVRKWTRKVNLFEKDYVFIPVNYNYHWSLIVICHPGEVANFQDEDIEKALKLPCILHMDSIKGNHTGLKDFVQSYLVEEWKEKHKEACEDISSMFFNLRFVPLELPQQQNSFDCGLFLLHYVERFLQDAPLNFSPFTITKFSSFLNVDWFPAAEPSLKRVAIQNLICTILEKENSSAACSGNPCASISSFPACNNEIETGVELISERCSPSKSCRGKSSCSPADEGIAITLLPSSSQCAGDSSLVLREFFEEGTTARSFLDGQFHTFERAASFSEFKSGMSLVEEEVEAGEQFIYSESNVNGFHPTAEVASAACVFPYSSGDLEAETTWKQEFQQAGREDIDASPETSFCASDDSLEVVVEENNIVEEDPDPEEKVDQPRSPSPENLEMLGVADTQESSDHVLESNGDEVLDVVDSQLSNPLLDSNGDADHLIPDVQENGDAKCADMCLVGDNSVSESDGKGVLERIDGESVLESDRQPKRIGDDSVSEESDEMQPAKRPRLTPPAEGERMLTRSLSKDLQL